MVSRCGSARTGLTRRSVQRSCACRARGGAPTRVCPTRATRGGTTAASVLVALGLLEQPNRSRPKRLTLPAQGLLVRKDYGGPAFPSGPERLLAAFRVWAVFEYCFPHRDIMGEDWDRALIDAIDRVGKARDAIEYVDAISRMTSLTHDTHLTVRSKAVGDYSDSSLPIRLGGHAERADQ